MGERVRITDVAARDGLQNEPGVIPTADKVRLIQALAAAGVDEIELTSFVSPRWVPQLADAEAVVEAVKAWARSERAPVRMPVLSALVPNEQGFARALALQSEDFPLKIAVFTAASETFSQRNTNASIAETIERFRAFLPRAFEAEMAVRLYVSCAIACPFEGPIAPEQIRRVADELLGLCPQSAIDAGRVEIDLGDTIGVATPGDIRALLSAFDEDPLRSLIVLHLHDTFSRAVECVKAGLDWGVRAFDGAVGGLGGCPYAGTKERRAPGNVATEALVEAAHQAGFATGVDLERLREAGRLAREFVARCGRAGARETL